MKLECVDEIRCNARQITSMGCRQRNARVINDGGDEGRGVARFETRKDEGESDDKQKRAAWVALRDTFPEYVFVCVLSCKWGSCVSGEIDSRWLAEEKAKPRREKRAVQMLYSTPYVRSLHSIESLLKIG
jgi:hypothetical protein